MNGDICPDCLAGKHDNCTGEAWDHAADKLGACHCPAPHNNLKPVLLRTEISSVLNRYSKEGGSGTPDFILAEYLMGCLEVFDKATNARDTWWGFHPKIGGTVEAKDL
jgi:hypothetical protein